MKSKINFSILPKHPKKFFMRLLVWLILVILGLYMFQRYLIYHPDNYSISELQMEAKRMNLMLWPSKDSYRGLLAEPINDVVGTAVITHGNAGSAIDRTYYIGPLLSLGYRVILLEYPGYGPRGGKTCENNIVNDVKASIELIREQYKSPTLLIGESLGSGVAASALDGFEDKIDGVILVTPWNDLPSVAQSVYWFLPARLLAREKYDSVAHLKGYTKRVAVVVASGDELIPEKCSKQLYDSLGCDKRFFEINGAGHNTWPEMVDLGWWRETVTYVMR